MKRTRHGSDDMPLAKRSGIICIYIIPQKIQKRRLQILHDKCSSNKFPVVKTFSATVTHVVTEFECVDEVVRCLNCDTEQWRNDIYVIKTTWISECIRQKELVTLSENYIIPCRSQEVVSEVIPLMPEYECQRSTSLYHQNLRFTTPLEVLQKNAEFLNDDENYSRALAFRRGACTLKNLSQPVKYMRQVTKLPHVGSHIQRVIQDILEIGFSSEAQEIENSDWFQTIKLFTGIYGVGPTTANKWFQMGLRTLHQVTDHLYTTNSTDSRVATGIAYYSDLNLAVARSEADAVLKLIEAEIESISPGATAMLVGGFLREKPRGHDIDILLSHPEEGGERDLLSQLVERLSSRGLILHGKMEPNSFSADKLQQELGKGQYLRSTLDHFEKWLGVLKVEKSYMEKTLNSNEEHNPTTSAPNRLAATASPADSIDVIPEPQLPQQALQRQSSSLSRSLDMASLDRTWLARRVDLIVVPASQYYYALVGWTGSRQFNRSMRLYAKREHNMVLTSHGLYSYSTHQSLPAHSEKEVFDHLKLTYRAPSERNC